MPLPSQEPFFTDLTESPSSLSATPEVAGLQRDPDTGEFTIEEEDHKLYCCELIDTFVFLIQYIRRAGSPDGYVTSDELLRALCKMIPDEHDFLRVTDAPVLLDILQQVVLVRASSWFLESRFDFTDEEKNQVDLLSSFPDVIKSKASVRDYVRDLVNLIKDVSAHRQELVKPGYAEVFERMGSWLDRYPVATAALVALLREHGGVLPNSAALLHLTQGSSPSDGGRSLAGMTLFSRRVSWKFPEQTLASVDNWTVFHRFL